MGGRRGRKAGTRGAGGFSGAHRPLLSGSRKSEPVTGGGCSAWVPAASVSSPGGERGTLTRRLGRGRGAPGRWAEGVLVPPSPPWAPLRALPGARPTPGRKFERAAPSERPRSCGFRGPVRGWRASLGPGRGRRPPPPVPVRLDPFCSCRVSSPGPVRGESPAAGRPGAASPGWAESPSSVAASERRDVRKEVLGGRSLAFREGEGERCSRGAGFWRSWRKGRNAPGRVRSAGTLPRGSRF